MNRHLKLLAVLAHPDDESLGFGGTLAKYAAEGVQTYLVTASLSLFLETALADSVGVGYAEIAGKGCLGSRVAGSKDNWG